MKYPLIDGKLLLHSRIRYVESQIESRYPNVSAACFDEGWEYPTILVIPASVKKCMYIPHFFQGYRLLSRKETWQE